MFIVAGAGVGLVAGLGLTFLKQMLDTRVVSVAAVEQSLSLPVLAKIPYLSRKDLATAARPLTITEYLSVKPLSHYAQSVRALRVGLRITGHRSPIVVQLTSAAPGEGKSTAAASLAASAAASGVRTVLVDLDFYHPAISQIFGLEGQPGVADVLCGDAVAGSALQKHKQLPLRILGAGSSARPRPEMLETRQFGLFVKELANHFELIVLYPPPVLAVSDAVIVSGVADAVLVVVAWRATPRNVVEQAVEQLRAAGAPLAGLVLNKMDPKQISDYGSYSYLWEGYRKA